MSKRGTLAARAGVALPLCRLRLHAWQLRTRPGFTASEPSVPILTQGVVRLWATSSGLPSVCAWAPS